MKLFFHLPIVYAYPESGAGAGAAGNGTGTPPAGADGAAAPAQVPAVPASDGTTPAGSEPKKSWTFPEDRTHWVNPETYKKSEALINRTATELERARAMIGEQQRRIAALAGVAPQNPDDVEAQKIADAFFAIPQFAHLRYITPEFLQSVGALLQDGSSIAAARDHVWNSHTDRFLDDLDAAFASEIGVDKLTVGQQGKLRAAFGALIPDERTNPEAHAIFARRYEANDRSLIEEFVKEYVSDMLEPARRQATIPTFRRPVPRSGPTAPVVTQRAKPDYSNMTVSQMLDAAEKEAEAVGR